MIETLASSLDLLFDWSILACLLIGTLGGVTIGAIPGVGPAVAIAILLPATFSMEPLNGLILLLGIYGSSMFGGALPAILINTPGTAVNALTTYDGYPMTQNGQARRALIFLAALLGIILVIVAHKEKMAAAGMMVGLGILFQSVGMEPVKYTFRYTFGFNWLTSGFDLIVVVLGLFAIALQLWVAALVY